VAGGAAELRDEQRGLGEHCLAAEVDAPGEFKICGGGHALS